MASRRVRAQPSLEARADVPFSRRIAPVLLVCACAVVYANALRGPRLLDDQRALVENMSIRQLSPLSGVLHPPRQMPVTGRPLVNLSFALNYALGELKVEGYRVWNIGVHALAGFALFGFLRLTFLRLAEGGAVGLPSAGAVPLAFVCALIWVVHPLNSETVNYLTQRTESMMGLFVLLTLYASARAAQVDSQARPSARVARSGRTWRVVAVLAAVAGVACKETALTIPLLVVAWDRAFAFSSLRAAWQRRRGLYLGCAASWVLFLYFARELPFFAPGGFEREISRWSYFLHQGPTILHYLRLAFWPRHLIFDYGAPEPITLAEVWPEVATIAALLGLTVVAWWRRPTLGYWGVWFFVTLAPASSFIPIPTEVGAERRMYLPLVAVIVIVGLACATLLGRLTSDRVRRRVSWALAAVLVVVLGATTMARNRDYADGVRIWQTVLERRPHPRAHEHLAMSLRDANRIDESMAHLAIAAPGSPNALHALASARLERGDRAGAIADYREFVTRHPDNRHIIEAREAFAAALLETGDVAGAVEQYRAIVTKNPAYARGRVGLAGALSRAGDVAGAKTEYREALRIQPQNLAALINLGLVEAASGETDKALETLRKALTLQPAALTARRRVVSLLLERKQFPELEAEARALIQYAPSDSDAHNVLGIALASQARYAPAKEAFAEAVRLDPSNTVAHQNLGRLP